MYPETEIAFNITKETHLKLFAFNFIWKFTWKLFYLTFNFTKENPSNFCCRQIYMETPLKIILTHLQFYKRNPFKFFEKKNQPWNLVSKIPSWTGKLEVIFEKSHPSSQILKIVGATLQLDQSFTPIRKLFCTFLY